MGLLGDIGAGITGGGLTGYLSSQSGGGKGQAQAGPDENAWANDIFQKTFGRDATQAEINQILPYFGSDARYPDVNSAKAFVGNLYQQQQNTPDKIYQRQQAQYLQDAPKFADQISSQFQQALGRAPTQDELTHFGALMASGQDSYQVGQALQQTQEYQNAANTKFQNKLQGELQGSNATYFNQYIAPSILSQAALAGRTPDSSGVNAQLANAALQQNQGLQQFLAGTTAQNYQNSVANATNQYQGLLGQQYGLQNAGVSSGLANQATNQQYSQNMNMYNLQQQAYNRYLQQYGKRNNGLGGLVGGIAGAGLGALYGGPAGATAGYGIGSGLGNAASNGSAPL